MNDKSRHLVRKFLEEGAIKEDFHDVINSSPITSFTKKELKAKQQCFIITENSVVKGFTYNTLKLPSVHPVAVYYDMALRQEEYLFQSRQKILEKANSQYDVNELQSLLFYYIGISSVFSTQLVASLECFCNLLIKDDTSYQMKDKDKTLIGQDISWLSLSEKVEFLIAEITGKEEFDCKNLEIVKKLIIFRNDSVHPKKDKEFAMDNYENLFRSALSFNYKNSLKSVKSFINYHSENDIIEECFCYSRE